MDEQCNPCTICKQSLNKDGIALAHKGSEGVSQANQEREATILTARGDMVHTDCRLIIAALVVLKSQEAKGRSWRHTAIAPFAGRQFATTVLLQSRLLNLWN